MSQQKICRETIIIRSSCSNSSRCNSINLMKTDLVDRQKIKQQTEHAALN